MREMLYEAVFWRPNPNKPSFEEGLINPGVSNALIDWGAREGDAAVIALVDSIPAGAAWYRFYTNDTCIRGYIDETIPTIAIAVHKNYRRQGIGVISQPDRVAGVFGGQRESIITDGPA